MFITVGLFLLAYLMGSVCSAVIVSKIFALPDPRSQGSANPGATNVLRLAGPKYAAMVLVMDMLKGLIPVLIAQMMGVSVEVLTFCGFFAVLGHMFPIFFGFQGGKGVATTLGVLFGFHWFLGGAALLTWIALASCFRYSSLASMITVGLMNLYWLWLGGRMEGIPGIFLITLFVWFMHRDNLTRLIDGTESKIDFKSKMKKASSPAHE